MRDEPILAIDRGGSRGDPEFRSWMSLLMRALVRGARPADADNVDDAPGAWWCPNALEIRSKETWTNVDGESRHAGRCLGTACGNWSGFCRVGAAVAVAGPLKKSSSMTDHGLACVIKDRCRWRAENGPVACGGCPELRWGTPVENLSRRDVMTSLQPGGSCER